MLYCYFSQIFNVIKNYLILTAKLYAFIGHIQYCFLFVSCKTFSVSHIGLFAKFSLSLFFFSYFSCRRKVGKRPFLRLFYFYRTVIKKDCVQGRPTLHAYGLFQTPHNQKNLRPPNILWELNHHEYIICCC